MKIFYFIIVVSFFYSCSDSSNSNNEAQSQSQQVLNFFNWNDFISLDVIENFEKDTGIKVNIEYFASNEDMYSKISIVSNYYDVIVPSDYMLSRMYDEGLIHDMDLSKILNHQKYTIDFLKELDESKYSVPYSWGTVGILYNSSKINRPIDSISELFNPEYKNKIIMLDAPIDNFAAALTYLGYDINTLDSVQLNEAKALLLKQKKELNPIYYGDLNDELMVNEEAYISLIYSGDAMEAMKNNPNLQYVIPKEGANLWVDSLAILKDSPNKENAYKFIDYISRPENALKTSLDLGFTTPNKEALKSISKDIFDNKNFYPNDLTSIKLKQYKYHGKDYIGLYDDMWQEILTK